MIWASKSRYIQIEPILVAFKFTVIEYYFARFAYYVVCSIPLVSEDSEEFSVVNLKLNRGNW